MILMILTVTNYYLNERFFMHQTIEEKTFIRNILYLKSYYSKVEKLSITIV